MLKTEKRKYSGKQNQEEKIENTDCRSFLLFRKEPCKFLSMTITKKWYPVRRLKFYQSLIIKLP